MADITSSANQPCIVQAPRAPTEINWVEASHGVESIVTVVGLAIGAWWAYRNDWIKSFKERTADRELRESEKMQRQDMLEQRNRQLRWDQAKLAKEINDEFLADHDAQSALGIVDSDAATIDVTDTGGTPNKYTVDLEKREHVTALRMNPMASNKKEVFIRECFDAWFYWMSIMEQYVKNELIRQDDITYPSDYYIRCLREDEEFYEVCVQYIERNRLSPNILAFIRRFLAPSDGTSRSGSEGRSP